MPRVLLHDVDEAAHGHGLVEVVQLQAVAAEQVIALRASEQLQRLSVARKRP